MAALIIVCQQLNLFELRVTIVMSLASARQAIYSTVDGYGKRKWLLPFYDVTVVTFSFLSQRAQLLCQDKMEKRFQWKKIAVQFDIRCS